MTVKELITILEKYDQNSEVKFEDMLMESTVDIDVVKQTKGDNTVYLISL